MRTFAAAAGFAALAFHARAQDVAGAWRLGAQATVADQTDLAVRSPFRGANSLAPAAQSRETIDATAYAGLRLWTGAEVFVSPEVDQGFGLSNTLGAAGFPSAEAYKVGASAPYLRLQRAFFRQTLDLGGPPDPQDAGPLAFAATPSRDRLVLTVGKISVVDVFDANLYAHDPRGDFLNWSVVDAASFDYAADPWGYSYGAALEAYLGAWTLRGGLFDMSVVPNGLALETGFGQFELLGEIERRYRLGRRDGRLRLDAYDNRARYGDYAQALRLAQATGATPTAALALARRYRTHAGASLNLEQALGVGVGLFLRAGYADGHQQTYEYTDVDRAVSGGLSLAGGPWGRAADRAGVAASLNDISRDFRAYLAAGGVGLLIGDGRLPRYRPERIAEAYYLLALGEGVAASFDVQRIAAPGYDAQRGPATVFGVRLHLQGEVSGR